MRGSCSSNRLVVAATSRMASDTRAMRCCFMITTFPRGSEYLAPGLLDFHFTVDELGDRVRLQGLDDFAEHLLDGVRLVAHHGHAEDDRARIVLSFDLGN